MRRFRWVRGAVVGLAGALWVWPPTGHRRSRDARSAAPPIADTEPPPMLVTKAVRRVPRSDRGDSDRSSVKRILRGVALGALVGAALGLVVGLVLHAIIGDGVSLVIYELFGGLFGLIFGGLLGAFYGGALTLPRDHR